MLAAEFIALTLKKHGVTHVFDVAGGMIAYIEDAISRTKGIECTPNHHEQACGFSAEGYARISRNFGVAMATSGPGATNLVTAIGSCYFDSVPALFITGQVHTDNIRKDARIRQVGFQETDIVSMVKSITKYAAQVTKVEEIIYELEKAIFMMRDGRPGPVLLDIPINIQRTELPLLGVRHFLGSREHTRLVKKTMPPILPSVLQKVHKVLAGAKRPVVVLGGGVRVSGTLKQFWSFVKRNRIPVVSSLLGLDAVDSGYAYYAGFVGSYGVRSSNIVLAQADVVLALGSRLDVRQVGNPKDFSRHKTIIHVDIDPASIGATVQTSMPVHMDLQTFFKVSQEWKCSSRIKWLHFVQGVTKEFGVDVNNYKTIDPNALIAGVSQLAESSATIVSDVGNHQMWLAQSWKLKSGQRLLFSGGMGSMGFGLPAAIGAYFAAPNRQLLLVCGDGGFQMNLQELETVRRNKIPLKIFVFNNKSLGMVREFQDQYFNKRYQSTVIGYSVPDLKKIAYAYDLPYVKIRNPKTQQAQLIGIMDRPGAMLIEVELDLYTKMEPKVMYGHSLDDQYPFLSGSRKARLDELKSTL